MAGAGPVGSALALLLAGCGQDTKSTEQMTSYSGNTADKAELFTVPADQMQHIQVVPAQQSIAMAERLQARGVPVELVLFEGEGHGFRDGSVQRRVLERTEAFFRATFGLPDASGRTVFRVMLPLQQPQATS